LSSSFYRFSLPLLYCLLPLLFFSSDTSFFILFITMSSALNFMSALGTVLTPYQAESTHQLQEMLASGM
jgi:hypothetical protein